MLRLARNIPIADMTMASSSSSDRCLVGAPSPSSSSSAQRRRIRRRPPARSPRKMVGAALLPVVALLLLMSVRPVRGFSVRSVASPLVGRGGAAYSSFREFENPPPVVVLRAKKGPTEKDPDEKDGGGGGLLGGVFKKSPGAAIVAPFVLLFGLDLVLNIAVVTKRSLEVFFTGEYTVWTPWQ